MDKQEPVAWMYRREYDGWIQFSLERGFSRMPPFTDEGVWTETPLYTRANRPADDCPSCHGLNISCPEGCGRDPLTGELNGTTLIRPADDGLVARLEALAAACATSESLEDEVGGVYDLGAFVRQNLPAILTALRAQSDAEVERIVAYVRREGGTVGEWLAMGIEAGEHRKGGA